MDTAIKRHGGKAYLARWVVSLMPSRAKNPNAPAADDPGWLHYVEPYFGGGSVLFANNPEGISEVVNDLNGELMNFWRVLQSPGDFAIFREFVRQIPFAEASFWQAIHTVEDAMGAVYPGALAAAFFVRNRQSRQGLGKDFATLTRNRTRRGMNEQVSSWLSAIDGLPWFHERLKRVLILNRPALDVIRQQDGPRTLFYLDPPYPHETRSTTIEYGRYEMTPDQHKAILDALATITGRFMLSGYRSDLYDRYAAERGWRRHEMEIDNKAASGETKQLKTECVWCNF